ncbi:MAG: glycosyltransferase [Mucilaginibacter polytrichastri]|nr:glycosyltransferase [Mucilaginibacter polytrichastri]
MPEPRLSIITVVYNNVEDIGRTLRSVTGQTWPHIEYIVIDGASTDGTLEMLGKFSDKISTLISEPDKGIYDAMNKGLRLVTGDYVLFMNSGDELYTPDTVERVFQTAPDADIYYGETEMIDAEGRSLGRRRHRAPAVFTYKSFRYGMSVSHQAIYIRRSLTGFYDPEYLLSADIDWILSAVKNARKIVRVEGYVAKYLVGGLSKKRHRQSLIERFKIMRKHYGLLPTIFNHGVITLRLLLQKISGTKKAS